MNLKRYLLAGSTIILSASVLAQPRAVSLPQIPGMDARSYAMLNASLRDFDRQILMAAPAAAAKTTAVPQRLIGRASDQWNGTRLQLVDTLSLEYSGSRGSTFSDYLLSHVLGYAVEEPGVVEFRDSYLNYDKATRVNTARGVPVTYTYLRRYDADNRLTYTEFGGIQHTTYGYNPAGKLAAGLMLRANGSGGYDSASRFLVTYHSNGSLDRYMQQIYDSSSSRWKENWMYSFTTNAAGQITVLQVETGIDGNIIPFHRLEYSYGSNGRISGIEDKLLDGSVWILRNKDSMDYIGDRLVYWGHSSLDEATGNYVLARAEWRHLNAQGLPDSSYDYNPLGGDMYSKLVYNANGNPTRMTDYIAATSTPNSEDRFYYEDMTTSVPKLRAIQPLSLRPNPAVAQLYLDNKAGGRFRITDLSGRLVMDGSVGSSAIIGIEDLTPGVYSIVLNDAAGRHFSAQFVKQ